MTPLRHLLHVVLSASCTIAVEVSVCHDATYDIAVNATELCSGAGSEPAGRSCPKAGDVAVADCLSSLASYESERCVAPEDAVCQVVHDDTWGCVLPSVGCTDVPIEVVVESSCETWDYNGDDATDSFGSFDGNEDFNENWFTKTTKLRTLYDCGKKPTPAPTTRAPRAHAHAPTPAPTTRAPMTPPANSESNTTNALSPNAVSETTPSVAENDTARAPPQMTASQSDTETEVSKPVMATTVSEATQSAMKNDTKGALTHMEDTDGYETETKTEASTPVSMTTVSEATQSAMENHTMVALTQIEDADDYETDSDDNEDDTDDDEDDTETEVSKPVMMTTKDNATETETDGYETDTETEASTLATMTAKDNATKTEKEGLTPMSVQDQTPVEPDPEKSNGSPNNEAKVGMADQNETEVGGKENGAGKSTKTTLAASNAVSFDGLSDEALTGVAAAIAFAAVVMVAIVVAYARKRHVKRDAKEEEEEEEADSDEKEEDEDIDEESHESSSLALPTPAVVTKQSATTPSIETAKTKVRKRTATTAGANAAKTTLDGIISENTDDASGDQVGNERA